MNSRLNTKTICFFIVCMAGLLTAVLVYSPGLLQAMDVNDSKRIRGRVVAVEFEGWSYSKQSFFAMMIRSGGQKYKVYSSPDTIYLSTQAPGVGDRIMVEMVPEQNAWRALKLGVITVGP